MTPSERCVALVKRFEGLRLQAYQCPAGLWTCGYGHTKGVTPTTTCTPAQAEEWLKEDLDRAARTVQAFVQVPLTQNQFDALVGFVFNVGPEKFRKSTLLKLLNRRDYAGAAGEFGKWVFGGGKRLPGLVARRKAEMEMFLEEA